GDATAKPKMSNPQDTLATVAGADALIAFIIGLIIVLLFGIVTNTDNVGKYTSSCDCGAGAWTTDHHGPLVVPLSGQQYNIIAAGKRIERMLIVDRRQADLHLSFFQAGHVAQLFPPGSRLTPHLFKIIVVCGQCNEKFIHRNITPTRWGYKVLHRDIIRLKVPSRLTGQYQNFPGDIHSIEVVSWIRFSEAVYLCLQHHFAEAPPFHERTENIIQRSTQYRLDGDDFVAAEDQVVHRIDHGQ